VTGNGAATTVQGIEVSWDRTAELFPLDSSVAYLNHGAFGVAPVPAQRAQQRLRDEVEANPMAFFTRGLADRLAHTRRHLAAFLGADPDGTALVPNATAGTQIVFNTLRLQRGDEILLTTHGYGAVLLSVQRLGLRVTEADFPIGASDDQVVAAIVGAARPGRTRLVVIDHVSSPTAMLLPVARICTALRELGIPVLVDGAHVPGMLAVDVASLNADFWLGNLHKWAFAPRPTAVLVVRPEHRAKVQPLVVSWNQPTGFPGAVEFGGSLDYTAWLAAPTGLHVLRTLGVDRVRRHNATLADYGQRVLTEALGVEPFPVPPTGSAAAQVSMRLVRLPIAATQEATEDLERRIASDLRCEVPVLVWSGGAFVRLAAQVYNRPEQYDRLAAGLPALVGRRAKA
jgi:isopenicillin-N epimerase